MIKGLMSFGFLLVLIANSANVFSQISFGGAPAKIETAIDVIDMPPIPQRVSQRLVTQEGKLKNKTFAHPFYVGLTPTNSGEWEVLNSRESLWRLAIRSEGAKSLNLIFDDFKLTSSSKLFIYSPDKSEVLGSFTDQNNSKSGTLATAPIMGEEVIVELLCESNDINNIELEIGTVNHDYVGLKAYVDDQLKSAGNCHPDVACETINSKEATQSVCMLLVDGVELCTGTMINNTSNDGTPYMLTAAHCFSKYDNVDQNVILYYNYQYSKCGSLTGATKSNTISGLSVVSFSEELDFLLGELSSTPPKEYNVYWAGWNRDASVSGPVYTIHHPQGDVKKVSVDNDSPTNTTFDITKPNGVQFLSNAHWYIKEWDTGATEFGSSGAGLFTVSGEYVGGLSGGQANCSTPKNDYFFRLNKAWDHYPNPKQQLKYWLDPMNSGATSIDGLDFYDTSVDVNKVSIEVFPNPVENGLLSFRLSGHSIDQIEFYSIAGQKMFTTIVNSSSNVVSVNVLPASVYVVLMKRSGKVIGTQKLVVK